MSEDVPNSGSTKLAGEKHAVATVVRTVSATAAKPGAKAIINAAGTVVEGWIGGGCAQHAVIEAALKSINDGEPRLVSVQPEDLLREQGLSAGEEQQGVVAAANRCPSQGSMEIFVEPVMTDPELLVLGSSPVAFILAELATSFAFSVAIVDTQSKSESRHSSLILYQSFKDIPVDHHNRYIVVATQGSGDLNALQTALALQSKNISFVGSVKKAQYLKNQLRDLGSPESSVNSIKGPAGLDIGAVTPQEIALSILAEIVSWRRKKAT